MVCANLKPRVALALGGALCVAADIEAALQLGEYASVVACNDIAAEWPGQLDAMVTLHPEKLPMWLANRDALGYEPPRRVFVKTGWRKARDAAVQRAVDAICPEEIDYMFPGQTRSGSSGLFAAKAALVDLGFDKVVCCGIPMTPEAMHLARQRRWRGASSMREGWTSALPSLTGRVASISGWTRDMIGAPDKEFFNS